MEYLVYREVAKERDELREWKRSAMDVLQSLSLQEVGDELGVKLGHPIAPEILPRVKALKEEVAKLRDALHSALVFHNLGWTLPDVMRERYKKLLPKEEA